MSNVGACPHSEQNSCPESSKVSEAEGETFEGFDNVVAALGKAVGQANVECVQDVGAPVGEHFAAELELREIQEVVGFQSETQTTFGFAAAGRGHEIVKRLFEGARLQKPVRKAEHYVHGGAVFF